MRGFIEVKEDSYEDVIEHLHRIKMLTCKLIKKLSEQSEIYDDKDDYEEKQPESRSREGYKGRGRYGY